MPSSSLRKLPPQPHVLRPEPPLLRSEPLGQRISSASLAACVPCVGAVCRLMRRISWTMPLLQTSLVRPYISCAVRDALCVLLVLLSKTVRRSVLEAQ